MARRKRDKLYTSMFVNTVLTMAIIELSHIGASFVDGVITTKYMDATSLAAIGIIRPIFSLIGVFSGFLTVGTQIKCTAFLGEGKTEKARSLMSFSVTCGVAIGILITLICCIFPSWISTLFGAQGTELVALSKEYLIGVAIGAVPTIFNAILAMAFTLEGHGNYIRIVALINALVNIGLDLVAVKTNLGIFGIGLATSCGATVQFILILIPIILKKTTFRFTFLGYNFKDLKEIAFYGSEKVFRRLSNCICPIVINNIAIAIGGSLLISALSARNSICDFSIIPYAGISSAVGFLSGVFHGEKNKDGLICIGVLAHRTIGIVSLIAAGILIGFCVPISNFYSFGDSTLYSYVLFSVICLAINLPLRALIDSRLTYMQGIKKSKVTTALSIVNRLVFPVIVCYILGKTVGVYGIIGTFLISDILTLATIFLCILIDSKSIPFGIKYYLFLDKEFDIPPEDTINLTVNNSDDVALTSWQLQLFCQGHKFNKSSSMMSSICLEELLTLINAKQIENKKIDPIHVRVTLDKDGDLILRTRDSCDSFNFINYLEDVANKVNEEDGINSSLFKASIKDVRLMRCVNTNVYYIKMKM